MLFSRVLTTIVLLVILALSMTTATAFAVLVSLSSALMLFEWLRICLPSKKNLAVGSAFLAFFLLLVCYSLLFLNDGKTIVLALRETTVFQENPWIISFFSLSIMLQFFISFVWIFIIPMFLSQAKANHLCAPSRFHAIFAVFAIFGTWFTMIVSYVFLGVWFLLSFLMIVWCADIFAYFGGKYFGGSKLAPHISPGKTRSGAICGISSVVIWMLVSAFIEGSFASLINTHMGLLGTIFVGIVLALLSIIGDLYESLLKRRAGVKDSSALLPGHGGIWDRFDSVLAISPLVFCFVFLFFIQ